MINNCNLFLLNQILLVVALMFLSAVFIVPIVAGEALDNGIYISRSNVMSSNVEPSFWDDPEPLTIKQVNHGADFSVVKWGKISHPVSSHIIISPQSQSTEDYGSIILKSQELAMILVNNPYYQAGYSGFMLDDNQQVKLSSVKYALTNRYYGRTDISSSWVTKFYNAAYNDDYQNLTVLLDGLQGEP